MEKLKNNIESLLYLNISKLPWYQAKSVFALKILIALIRDLKSGQISLRAMSLVYTTVISLVPLLAVSFSVLKGFGAHNEIKPMIQNTLEPLGTKSLEITDKLVEFVDNIEVGVLGAVGIGFLLFTVISMIQKIEKSFNYIWNISKNRSFSRRFADYLSVLLIGPVLIFSSAGLSTATKSNEYFKFIEEVELFNNLISLSAVLVPYLILSLAFAFIYNFVPNTKVNLKAALIAGLVTSIIWKMMGWGFAEFISNSANHVSIYAAFATIIIFMIWLYLAWFVLLIGASISYYVQYPNAVIEDRNKLRLSNEQKEKLALNIAYLIAKDFEEGKNKITIYFLSKHFGLPQFAISNILDNLVNENIIAEIRHPKKQDKSHYVLAKPSEKVSIIEILNAIRKQGNKRVKFDKEINELIKETEKIEKAKFENKTLKDFIS